MDVQKLEHFIILSYMQLLTKIVSMPFQLGTYLI